MAAVGDVIDRRGKQILTYTFPGITTGETVDRLFVGGWPDLITAYFEWPVGLTAGTAQLIVAHDINYSGDWELFGPVPTVVADAVRTLQVPGNGVNYLGVRVTQDIVTNPVGGFLVVHIVAH